MRVYYQCPGPASDTRLLGVELEYGQAVDVPDHLGEQLVKEPCFAVAMGPVVTGASAALPDSATRPEIAWYEPEPGEELLALDGIGKGRARTLVGLGLVDLEAMGSLVDSEVEVVADALSGVDLSMVLAWREEAKVLKENSA